MPEAMTSTGRRIGFKVQRDFPKQNKCATLNKLTHPQNSCPRLFTNCPDMVWCACLFGAQGRKLDHDEPDPNRFVVGRTTTTSGAGNRNATQVAIAAPGSPKPGAALLCADRCAPATVGIEIASIRRSGAGAGLEGADHMRKKRQERRGVASGAATPDEKVNCLLL